MEKSGNEILDVTLNLLLQLLSLPKFLKTTGNLSLLTKY